MLCPWHAKSVHAFSCAMIGCPSCEAIPASMSPALAICLPTKCLMSFSACLQVAAQQPAMDTADRQPCMFAHAATALAARELAITYKASMLRDTACWLQGSFLADVQRLHLPTLTWAPQPRLHARATK